MQEKNLQCVFFHLLLLLQTNEIVWSDCNAHLLLTFNDVSEEKDWPIEVNTDALE